MLPPTRDQWYNDHNFNADEEPSAPPPVRDDWWNEPQQVAPPQAAPSLPPPPARDDWWNDPNFNAQPPQVHVPSGDEVPYIGDTYAPPQAGEQAFTPKQFDQPPMPSTFGQAGESEEMARRGETTNPISEWIKNTPAAKALSGDVAGAALEYGKNLSPSAPMIADSIAAGLKGAYDATPNIGNALMGKPYDEKEALNEGFSANVFNPFKNPVSRGAMMALNEPFMQTYGKAYGATRSILDNSIAQAQKVYQDAVAKGDAAPIAAAKASYDFLQNSPTAPGMGLSGLAYRTGQELKQGKLTEPQKFVDYIANEVNNGRTSFEELHPIEQIIAGFVLPDPIFSTLQAGHQFGAAQKAVTNAIDRGLLKAEFGGFGDLNTLIMTGKKTAPRTIEDIIKAGDLTPTNTALDGMFGKRTPLTNSTLLSETARTVVNNLARGLDDVGKLDLFAALSKKAAGDGTWITHAKNIGLDPKSIETMGAEFVSAAGGNRARIFSPLESLYGEATGKVLNTLFSESKPEVLSTLLETAARGLAENATDEERALAKTASGQFAKMFADASDKIVGVDRAKPTGNALTKAWKGYQNFHSGLQLFTLGFPVRNIASGMADTALAKAGDPLGGLKWMWEAKLKNLSIKELYYQKTGTNAESLSRVTGNMRDYENVSKNIIQRGLEKLRVPESLTTIPQRFQAYGEQAMHANILYSQRLKVFDNLGGARLIDAGLMKAVENVAGKGKADALAKALSVAKSPGEVRIIANNALGGKDYLNIQPDLAPSLERAGLKDPLLVVANKATSPQQYAKEADRIGQQYFTSLADAKNLFTHDSDIAYAMKRAAEDNITLEGKSVSDAMTEANSFAWDNQQAKEAMKYVTRQLVDRAGSTPEQLRSFNEVQLDVADTMDRAAKEVRYQTMLLSEGKIDKATFNNQKELIWREAFDYAYTRWGDLAQDLNAQVIKQGGKPADLGAVVDMAVPIQKPVESLGDVKVTLSSVEGNNIVEPMSGDMNPIKDRAKQVGISDDKNLTSVLNKFKGEGVLPFTLDEVSGKTPVSQSRVEEMRSAVANRVVAKIKEVSPVTTTTTRERSIPRSVFPEVSPATTGINKEAQARYELAQAKLDEHLKKTDSISSWFDSTPIKRDLKIEVNRNDPSYILVDGERKNRLGGGGFKNTYDLGDGTVIKIDDIHASGMSSVIEEAYLVNQHPELKGILANVLGVGRVDEIHGGYFSIMEKVDILKSREEIPNYLKLVEETFGKGDYGKPEQWGRSREGVIKLIDVYDWLYANKTKELTDVVKSLKAEIYAGNPIVKTIAGRILTADDYKAIATGEMSLSEVIKKAKQIEGTLRRGQSIDYADRLLPIIDKLEQMRVGDSGLRAVEPILRKVVSSKTITKGDEIKARKLSSLLDNWSKIDESEKAAMAVRNRLDPREAAFRADPKMKFEAAQTMAEGGAYSNVRGGTSAVDAMGNPLLPNVAKPNPSVNAGTLDPSAASVLGANGQMQLPHVPYDPVQAEKLNAAMDALRDFRAQRDYTVKNWGVKFSDATPEQAAAIQAVIKDYEMRFNSLNLLADRVGTQMADQVLFNFGDKRSVDQYLSAAVSYPYWYTRNMLRQTSKLWENPHQLWALQNMHDQVKEWNAKNGITDPAKRYNLNVGDVSVPIFGNFDTSASLDTNNYRNRTRDEDPLGWVFNTAESVMSPHAGLYDIMGALAYMANKPELALTYAAGASTTTNMLGAGAMKLGVSGNVAHPIEKVKSALLPQYGMFFVKDDKGQDVYIGSTSDQKKMQMELVKMVNDGALINGKPVTNEAVQQAQVLLHKMGDSNYHNDPGYAQAWAILKEAATRAQTNRIITTDGNGNPVPPYLGATLLSYFGGPGARYSVEAEKEIEASQAKLRSIMEQKDALIAAGKKDEYAQLMRDYWTDPTNQLYALYRMGNSDDVEESYAWGVLSRMGVGIIDNPAAKAAGMNQELLNKFYEAGGMPKEWTRLERQEFMSSIGILGSVLSIPALATQSEWNQARSEYKAMQAAIAAQYTPTQLANYEQYAYGHMTKVQADAFAKLHPEVVKIEQDIQGYMLSSGNELLAAYYGSNVTFEKYAKQKFEAEHKADGDAYRRYQALAELGKTDEVNKAIANDFYTKNKAVIKKYEADRAKFNKELDGQVEKIRAMLPEPKLATIRPDAEKSIVTNPIIDTLAKQKADYAGMGTAAQGIGVKSTAAPELDDAETWAKKYADSLRNDKLKEQTAKANAQGYLTGANKDTYEVTLQTAIGDQWTDPRDKQRAFYETDKRGWKIYEQMDEPAELMNYLGDKGSLREAILTDPTNKWTAVVAYVRKLTPDQLKQLKLSVEDVDLVWAKAQAFTDAPSEYARSRIVGVNVTFTADGGISTSNQSVTDYFKDIGGFPKAGGTTSGSGSATRTTTARTTTSGGSRGGGYSAPQTRISAPSPRAAPVDETPALSAEWDSFQSTLSGNPDLLVKLQDYFAQPELLSQTRLKNDPVLALWVSQQDPIKMARLRKAYLAWAKMRGLLGATQQAAIANLDPTLRVYPRRSGRSGL